MKVYIRRKNILILHWKIFEVFFLKCEIYNAIGEGLLNLKVIS